VAATIALGGPDPDTFSGPFGVDVNPATDVVYVSVQDQDLVAVIDGSTNTLTTTIPVAGSPYGLAVDAPTGNVYVALNSAGELAVIDGVTNAVAGSIAVGTAPWGVAVNPATAMAYVSNAGNATVSAIRLVGAPCENFNHQISGDDVGVHFDWQSVGDPTGRDV
jgi:YVTN family beta-propeller protein